MSKITHSISKCFENLTTLLPFAHLMKRFCEFVSWFVMNSYKLRPEMSSPVALISSRLKLNKICSILMYTRECGPQGHFHRQNHWVGLSFPIGSLIRDPDIGGSWLCHVCVRAYLPANHRSRRCCSEIIWHALPHPRNSPRKSMTATQRG